MRKKLSVVAGFVVAGALIPVGLVVAGGEEPPPRPAWVRADGTVDESKLPDSFAVSGPDGKTVVCPNGKELRVPARLMPPPPAVLRAQGQPPAEGYVWRCGTGPSAHLRPRLVRASEDPLRHR